MTSPIKSHSISPSSHCTQVAHFFSFDAIIEVPSHPLISHLTPPPLSTVTLSPSHLNPPFSTVRCCILSQLYVQAWHAFAPIPSFYLPVMTTSMAMMTMVLHWKELPSAFPPQQLKTLKSYGCSGKCRYTMYISPTVALALPTRWQGLPSLNHACT